MGGSRKGHVILYLAVAIPAVVGFCTFAVDYGRVQLAKSQLRIAADSATRAAAQSLPNGVASAQASAVAMGAANTCDGVNVAIDSTNDVQFLWWNEVNRTYATLSGAARSGANAIRVTAQRSPPRGNSINLTFGPIVGASHCDVLVTSTAISRLTPATYGVIALSKFDIDGDIDSYDSSAGSYSSGSANNNARVACNNDIKMKGFTIIHGDAWHGVGGKVISGTVTGSIKSLSANIVAPSASAGYAASTNDNGNLPGAYYSGGNLTMSSGTYTVPAGTYCVTNINLSGTATMNVTAPTTIYVSGSVSMSNSAKLNTGRPGNLRLTLTGGNNITLSNSAALSAIVYAPNTQVDLNGTSAVCGLMTCDQITSSNNAWFHMDESLNVASLSNPQVVVVK